MPKFIYSELLVPKLIHLMTKGFENLVAGQLFIDPYNIMSRNFPYRFCDIRDKFRDISKLIFTKFCDISSHNYTYKISMIAGSVIVR